MFAFLLPLLLLVPLRRHGEDAHGDSGGVGSRQRRLDRWIERQLRWLMWPLAGRDHPAPAGRDRPAPPEAQSVPGAAATLLLRWCMVLAVMWSFSCVLEA